MASDSALKTGVSRRAVLAGVGAVGALAVTSYSTPVRAQQATLRWWSPQAAPAQREAYLFQIAQFEKANPGVKVLFEPTSDEAYAQQLAAAFGEAT
jgi:multiple sugar transport system substrate-binding protein